LKAGRTAPYDEAHERRDATLVTPPIRTILAFLVAPLTPALALTFFALFGGGPIAGLALGFYAMMLNATVGYPVALAAGLPLYLIFRRLRWVGLGRYLAAGLALGAATGAVGSSGLFQIGEPGEARPLGETLVFVAAGAACGALVAASFWLIARPDRSDRAR
jgi:hypothetical protein